MKKLLVCLCLWRLSSFTVLGYTLTNTDYNLLDRVEDKLFDLMEERSREGDYVVDIIQQWMSTATLSNKNTQLLVQLIDDIQYYRYDSQGNNNDIYWYMLAEDCYEDEYYDAEDEWCYPLKDDIDIDLGESHTTQESSDDLPILASYTLDDADQLVYTSGIQDDTHISIWTLFAQMIPAAARADLVQVQFADNTDSNTAAYVEQMSEDYTQRKIVFNIDSYYMDGQIDIAESTHTNIHEYAHILTLNTTQAQLLDPDLDESARNRYQDRCTTYFLQEWCLLPNSYFKAFVDQFWDEHELTDAWDYEEADDYSAAEYVSDYAATNPGEDIAESFTEFVLKQKQTGSTEAQQKINFFYEYPELVKLRSFIRSRITHWNTT